MRCRNQARRFHLTSGASTEPNIAIESESVRCKWFRDVWLIVHRERAGAAMHGVSSFQTNAQAPLLGFVCGCYRVTPLDFACIAGVHGSLTTTQRDNHGAGLALIFVSWIGCAAVGAWLGVMPSAKMSRRTDLSENRADARTSKLNCHGASPPSTDRRRTGPAQCQPRSVRPA